MFISEYCFRGLSFFISRDRQQYSIPKLMQRRFPIMHTNNVKFFISPIGLRGLIWRNENMEEISRYKSKWRKFCDTFLSLLHTGRTLSTLLMCIHHPREWKFQVCLLSDFSVSLRQLIFQTVLLKLPVRPWALILLNHYKMILEKINCLKGTGQLQHHQQDPNQHNNKN